MARLADIIDLNYPGEDFGCSNINDLALAYGTLNWAAHNRLPKPSLEDLRALEAATDATFAAWKREQDQARAALAELGAIEAARVVDALRAMAGAVVALAAGKKVDQAVINRAAEIVGKIDATKAA